MSVESVCAMERKVRAQALFKIRIGYSVVVKVLGVSDERILGSVFVWS